ncbi:uracil-DNA glycosylase [Metarhizium rileyi]|uniref:Uracil-DNA glycosylase n=1 Tax=Metarhizium rileyi (strain RCEF 4871) TaxID=1649241 RepID=A0A162JNN7_METRR|nr:uracil-DNA glycosylase [Metarhizium rileyi RCEF 4871]
MSTLKRKGETLTKGAEAKKSKTNGSIASFFSSPKHAAGNALSASAAPAVKFDKQKWLASLTAEQKQLLKLEIETLHDSWLAHLKDDITTKDFLELKKFLDRETKAGRKWFPPKEDVYSWSRHTPFHNVKVVILGQDPYHNDGQAHGLAFSVRPPTSAPPSLKNIYIALQKDYPTFVQPPNRGGLLTPWADRGVLMLNTCLTVRAHEANSHSNRGWERFTQRIIDLVAQKRTKGVVFVAWGTPAGKRVQKLDKQRHLVLQSVHPSPLSASRGFFDCGHFKKANEWLVKRYGDEGEIDWALSPGATTKTLVAAAANMSMNGVYSVKAVAKSVAKTETKGLETVKVARVARIEEDVDSEDEAALEEALRLTEEELKKY